MEHNRPIILKCPHCGKRGKHTKAGMKPFAGRTEQRYQCLACGRTHTRPIKQIAVVS